ncbi:MAG: bis(5'-nucleosyl)-tetraphosphatase [Candidatus Hydrothermarchaeaceae archaeon]
MPVKISAGAVVYRREEGNTKYLLLHYQSGHWDFPKGNVERGEAERETVAREVAEETGISDVVFREGFREEIRYFYMREGRTIFKKVVFYLTEARTHEVKLSYEHIGYDWLSYEEALGRLTYRNAKDILKKAHDFLVRENFDDR